MWIKLIFILPVFLVSIFQVVGQSELRNASFEESQINSLSPAHWDVCNKGATPDVLPGKWNVHTPASDGDRYLGLITRNDGTFESIGQQLSHPLEPSSCHTFTLKLCRSNTYSNFNLPIRLNVYLGKSNCDRAQLIVQSENIINTEWRKYQFSFIPKDEYSHIILEAYYGNGVYFFYNGNVLVDMLSNIKICPRA